MSFVTDNFCPLGIIFRSIPPDISLRILYQEILQSIFMLIPYGDIDYNALILSFLVSKMHSDGIYLQRIHILHGGVAEISFIAVIVTVKFKIHATCAFQRQVIPWEHQMPGGGVYAICYFCFQRRTSKAVFVNTAESIAVGGFQCCIVHLTNGGVFPYSLADAAVRRQKCSTYHSSGYCSKQYLS